MKSTKVMMSPLAWRLGWRCADDDNHSDQSAVRCRETTRRSNRSVCSCSCSRSSRWSCWWCRGCSTQTWWLRRMRWLSCYYASTSCASCSASTKSKAMCRDGTRPPTNGCAAMKSPRALRSTLMTASRISPECWRWMCACWIVGMSVGMRLEMGGGGDGARWAKCGILAGRAAVWDCRTAAAWDFRLGQHFDSILSRRGGGDDGACLPSSPSPARRVRCRPFSVSSFASEFRLFAWRVGD